MILIFDTPKIKNTIPTVRKMIFKLLSQLAYEGLAKRYPGCRNIRQKERVEKELAVIDELNNFAATSITWDIIQYSNRMGFMHVGRGSGANSIIAYCLGINRIYYPLELDLYFERFSGTFNRKQFLGLWSTGAGKTRRRYSGIYFWQIRYISGLLRNQCWIQKIRFRELGKVFGLPKIWTGSALKNPRKQYDQNSIVKQDL